MNYFKFEEASLISLIIFSCFFPEIMCSANQGHELWSREEMVKIAGYGEERLSTVLVTGSILCEACLHSEDQPRSFSIPGALVAVKCHTGRKSKSIQIRTVADEYGKFIIDLPSHLHAISNLEKKCLLHVLHIPRKSKCQPSRTKKHRGLSLSTVHSGMRTYTVGRIKLQHFTRRSLQTCIKKAGPWKIRLNDKVGTKRM